MGAILCGEAAVARPQAPISLLHAGMSLRSVHHPCIMLVCQDRQGRLLETPHQLHTAPAKGLPQAWWYVIGCELSTEGLSTTLKAASALPADPQDHARPRRPVCLCRQCSGAQHSEHSLQHLVSWHFGFGLKHLCAGFWFSEAGLQQLLLRW